VNTEAEYHIIPKALAHGDELALNALANKMMRECPYPGDIHPGYGDLKPQRLHGDIPGDIQQRCLDLASACVWPLEMVDPAYFIFYPPLTLMHPHKDRQPEGEHWRLGLVLKQRCEGGTLVLSGKRIELKEGDAYLFRADTVEHSITRVTAGYRLIMSLGMVRRNNV
jgi:hypothetical protein